MKTLILGLGNPILSDDGIGIRVARELKQKVKDVDVIEASVGGMSLLGHIQGYDKLIIVDSIKTEKGNPGDVYEMKPEDFVVTMHLSSLHGVNLSSAIELGRQLGYKIPQTIKIYAIEIEDNLTFSERCTEKVEASIPKVVKKIINGEDL